MHLNQIAHGKDPNYVKDPDTCQPEQWLPDQARSRKETPVEVIDHRLMAGPFGSRARMCLGARLAELETLAVLSRLVQDWKASLDPPNQTWDLKQPFDKS